MKGEAQGLFVAEAGNLHAKTLFERALDDYAKQAEVYFAEKCAAEKAAPDVRELREKELTKAKRHLDRLKMVAHTMGDIQAKLDEYREAGRSAIQGTRQQQAVAEKMMLAECHHPTRTLARFMSASGKPRPSPNHAAHHIVPGRGKTSAANRARLHIHAHGIRINDPDNGTWLPQYKKDAPHWSMPQSLSHLEYHTEGYEEWVHRELRVIFSEPVLRIRLNLIGKLLRSNHLPPIARKKKALS